MWPDFPSLLFSSFLVSLLFSSYLFFALIFLLFLFHHPLEVRFFSSKLIIVPISPSVCFLNVLPISLASKALWDGRGLVRTAHGKAAAWDSKVERFSRSLESEVSQASPRKLREASCHVFLSWGSHSFLHELLSPSASPFCLSLFVSLYLSCALTPSPFV